MIGRCYDAKFVVSHAPSGAIVRLYSRGHLMAEELCSSVRVAVMTAEKFCYLLQCKWEGI